MTKSIDLFTRFTFGFTRSQESICNFVIYFFNWSNIFCQEKGRVLSLFFYFLMPYLNQNRNGNDHRMAILQVFLTVTCIRFQINRTNLSSYKLWKKNLNIERRYLTKFSTKYPFFIRICYLDMIYLTIDIDQTKLKSFNTYRNLKTNTHSVLMLNGVIKISNFKPSPPPPSTVS